MGRPLVIAHRGASGRAHENSIAAFLLARDLLADAIELDIHVTVDGEFLVHHDGIVPGKGAIAEYPYQHFQYHRLPNGEKIPTLAQVLHTISRLNVWIEVKNLAPRWDSKLINTVHGGPSPSRYAIHSFDHRIVARLGKANPQLRTGILQSSYPIDLRAPLVSAGSSILWQQSDLIDRAMVDTLHADGNLIIAWTANESSEISRLVEMGVDGICGNYPDVIRSIVDGEGAIL